MDFKNYFLIIDNIDSIVMSNEEIESHIDFCKKPGVIYYEDETFFKFGGNDARDDMNETYDYLASKGFNCKMYGESPDTKNWVDLPNIWYQLNINSVQPEVGLVVEMELIDVFKANNGKVIDKNNMRFKRKRECLNMYNAFKKHGFLCSIIEKTDN